MEGPKLMVRIFLKEYPLLDCKDLNCKACVNSVLHRVLFAPVCQKCLVRLKKIRESKRSCRYDEEWSVTVNTTMDDYISREERILAHQKRVEAEMKDKGLLDEIDYYSGKKVREHKKRK